MGADNTDLIVEGSAAQHGPAVLIVSETRLYREGLAEALERDGALTIRGHSSTAEAALSALAELSPDVVLLDAAAGVDLAAAMARTAPQMRIVVFAMAEVSESVIAWAEAGAAGYIPQSTPLADVGPIVVEIMAGGQACAPLVASALIRRLHQLSEAATARSDEASGAALTAREMQIAGLISAGLSNKQIARQLDVGVATIKSHVHNLLSKLEVERRGQVMSRLASPPGWGGAAGQQQRPIRP